MKRLIRSRKGVSPVIAALLLIAISVAAAVITYSWVMTMISSQGSQAQTAIRIEDVAIDYQGTASQLKLNIRNSGGVTTQIQTLYVYDGDTRMVKYDGINYAIPAGETKEIGFTEAADWSTTVVTAPDDKTYERDSTPTFALAADEDFVVSHAYTIKIVTDNGFTVEGTYYSPSSFESS